MRCWRILSGLRVCGGCRPDKARQASHPAIAPRHWRMRRLIQLRNIKSGAVDHRNDLFICASLISLWLTRKSSTALKLSSARFICGFWRSAAPTQRALMRSSIISTCSRFSSSHCAPCSVSAICFLPFLFADGNQRLLLQKIQRWVDDARAWV